MAKNAVGLAIATEEYGAKFFANGGSTGAGVLEHPRHHKGPAKGQGKLELRLPRLTKCAPRGCSRGGA